MEKTTKFNSNYGHQIKSTLVHTDIPASMNRAKINFKNVERYIRTTLISLEQPKLVRINKIPLAKHNERSSWVTEESTKKQLKIDI